MLTTGQCKKQVCVCMCVVFLCFCMYVCNVYMYIRVYVCMYVCIYILYTYVYVCIYVCIHVCMYVCMYVYCTHICFLLMKLRVCLDIHAPTCVSRHTCTNLAREATDLPAEAPVKLTMTLGISLHETGEEGSSKREAFKRDVANDLARASSLPAENFKISKLSAGSVKRDLVSVQRDLSKLSAGSVIVDIDILPDPLGIALTTSTVARDLEQQAADPNSPLRSGKVTSQTKGIQVHTEEEANVSVHTREEANASVSTVVVAEEDGGGGGGEGGGGSGWGGGGADRHTQGPKQDLTPVSACCWVEMSTTCLKHNMYMISMYLN